MKTHRAYHINTVARTVTEVQLKAECSDWTQYIAPECSLVTSATAYLPQSLPCGLIPDGVEIEIDLYVDDEGLCHGNTVGGFFYGHNSHPLVGGGVVVATCPYSGEMADMPAGMEQWLTEGLNWLTAEACSRIIRSM